MPGRLDIEVPRDGHYLEGWRLRDIAGVALNLTGHTVTAAAQAASGTGPVVASAVIDLYDALNGRFNMKWTGTDFAGVEGATEIVRLAWKLRDTAPDGITKDIVAGEIILTPENS